MDPVCHRNEKEERREYEEDTPASHRRELRTMAKRWTVSSVSIESEHASVPYTVARKYIYEHLLFDEIQFNEIMRELKNLY